MKTIMLVLQLIPAVIAALRAIEEAIPGTGKGEQKLAMVREVLESVSADSKEMWPVIESAIGVIVKYFNLLGVFVKSEK